jgi:hypothetical protein
MISRMLMLTNITSGIQQMSQINEHLNTTGVSMNTIRNALTVDWNDSLRERNTLATSCV